MDNLVLLTQALGFIEENLTESIKTEDIAEALFCSKSTIEKLFRYFGGITIRDYVMRRRMSKAAAEIRNNPRVSFLDLGVKYGYGSNEAFTRAFTQVWHITPSQYRKNPHRFILFPGFYLHPEIMEDEKMIGRRKVDISELYDYMKEREDCYIVAADIRNLIAINKISREAGDIAILESLNRLEKVAGEDDILFRVGGDEFVILTDSKDEAYARKLKELITDKNGSEIAFQGENIPLGLYVTYFTMKSENLRYAELFARIQNEITLAKYETEVSR